MSKERGIIFKGWGVRAIRNMKPGVWPAEAIDPALPIKPMTRRTRDLDVVNERPDDWRFIGWASKKELVARFSDTTADEPTVLDIKCPYGIPGDGLWVRETWKYDDWTEEGMPWIRYRADDVRSFIDGHKIPEEWADRLADIWADLSVDFERKGRACDEVWRPSIFMPRWASREDLVVKEVRIERVQEIGDVMKNDIFASCAAEGYPHPLDNKSRFWIEWFVKVWDEINKARGFGWEANPWCFVISFMRLTKC